MSPVFTYLSKEYLLYTLQEEPQEWYWTQEMEFLIQFPFTKDTQFPMQFLGFIWLEEI